MATINPYLNFNGNCEEAFNFYKSVFGGEFQTFMRMGDAPAGAHSSEAYAKKIMHVALPISKETTLMGSDVPEMFGKITFGQNTYISILPESEEEAKKLFSGLSAGGKVVMPLEKAFWGALFGMFIDKFGVQWMVNYDANHKN